MSEDPFGPGGSLDGCIRIGEKLKSQKTGNMYPSKLDYFIATHPYARDVDTAPRHKAMNDMLADRYGTRDKDGKARPPQKITIILGGHTPDDVFDCGFSYWPGKTCACITTSRTGFKVAKRVTNGEAKEVECDRGSCPHFGPNVKPPRCNPFGTLRFRFEHAPKSGGHWKFTTHSWRSVRKLRDNLRSLYDYTKDLNGLEVDLEIETETATVNGQPTKLHTVRLSSHYSPAELAAGMGRKFVSPAKVEIALPVIKISEKETENSLQENSEALGLNKTAPSYDALSDEDFL